MTSPGTSQPVTIVDLGIQNVGSVVTAFEVTGATVKVIDQPGGLGGAGLAVVPGVGSFAAASGRLDRSGFGDAIREHVIERQRPLLGMCLGMQLLADGSEEHGEHPGLGLIAGRVVRLREQPPAWRVPNMGWREVHLTAKDSFVPDELDGRAFYHVHSFHMLCGDPDSVVGRTQFGDESVTAIVQRDNVVGTQFHPEKSQDAGLDLLLALRLALTY